MIDDYGLRTIIFLGYDHRQQWRRRILCWGTIPRQRMFMLKTL